jgi:hypothetical protein
LRIVDSEVDEFGATVCGDPGAAAVLIDICGGQFGGLIHIDCPDGGSARSAIVEFSE